VSNAFVIAFSIEPIVEIVENALAIGTPQGLPPGITVNFYNEQLLFSGTQTQLGEFEFSIPLLTDICGCETSLTYEGTFIIDSTIISVNLGNDTLVCATSFEIVPLEATQVAGLIWSTNETTATMNSSLQIEAAGCAFIDSITVTLVDNLALNLADNLVFCEDNLNFPYELDAGPNYQSYLWSNGSGNSKLH